MATSIKAPITGTVWKILVKEGDIFSEGDTIAILESMKMEIPLEAEDPGKVVAVCVQEGAPINEGQIIFTVQAA